MVARTYYDAPRGTFGARIQATNGWARLREVWFQLQEFDGEGLDHEMASALEVFRGVKSIECRVYPDALPRSEHQWLERNF